jgi:hypothetical protein
MHARIDASWWAVATTRNQQRLQQSRTHGVSGGGGGLSIDSGGVGRDGLNDLPSAPTCKHQATNATGLAPVQVPLLEQEPILLLLVLLRTIEQRQQCHMWSSLQKDAYAAVRTTTPDPNALASNKQTHNTHAHTHAHTHTHTRTHKHQLWHCHSHGDKHIHIVTARTENSTTPIDMHVQAPWTAPRTAPQGSQTYHDLQHSGNVRPGILLPQGPRNPVSHVCVGNVCRTLGPHVRERSHDVRVGHLGWCSQQMHE